MTNTQQLTIGMPAGSLANAQRGGNLIDLLEKSGFATSGYDKGGPSKFASMSYMFGWDGRPQEFGTQLGLNELDVAIAGDDWILERVIEMEMEYGQKITLERVMGLNRGDVRIVGITYDNTQLPINEFLTKLVSEKKLITVATEMPYLSLRWIQKKLEEIGAGDHFKNYSVQKYKTPSKIKEGVVIYETWGKTEAKVKNLGVDLGVEITQTGSAIKNYGLNIVDTVMESQSSIWINPIIKNNPEKKELLEMFLVNIYGVLFAENKVMLLFNIHNSQVKDVEKYLFDNNLFGDEPTVNRGNEFTEFNIQVDTANPSKPIARVRYELAKLGAKNINTIPIQSSIPSLKAING